MRYMKNRTIPKAIEKALKKLSSKLYQARTLKILSNIKIYKNNIQSVIDLNGFFRLLFGTDDKYPITNPTIDSVIVETIPKLLPANAPPIAQIKPVFNSLINSRLLLSFSISFSLTSSSFT